MTMILDNQPVNLAGRILDTLAGAAGRVGRRIRRRVQINRTRRLLRELPDNILKDIGISRSDILYLAEHDLPEKDSYKRALDSLRGGWNVRSLP